MTRWLLASLHLVALGIGLGAVWTRGRALRSLPAPGALGRAFAADATWGLAFLLWVSTGLIRLFAATEKPTAYYWQNQAFVTKMGLLGAILVLEVWPMVTLVRWRIRTRRGRPVDLAPARTFAWISFLQAGLVVLMVLAAAAMARGYGSGM